MSNKAPIKKEIGSTIPEGYKEVECAACKLPWYVPTDEVPDDAAFICPLCVQANADAVDATKAAAEAALKG